MVGMGGDGEHWSQIGSPTFSRHKVFDSEFLKQIPQQWTTLMDLL